MRPPSLASLGVILSGLLCGCAELAPPHQSWTEAEVQGRVVDAVTGKPLHGASVSRVRKEPSPDSGAGQHGALQIQDRPTVAMTDKEGRFVLDPVKTAYLFLESYPTFEVVLRIQHSGHETLQRRMTNVTWPDKKSPPLIQAGDIALKPLP
ncbi:MAG: hypothetical protein ACO3I0_02265 [Limisphaerales bacterium]